MFFESIAPRRFLIWRHGPPGGALTKSGEHQAVLGRLTPLIVLILELLETNHIVGQHRPITLRKTIVV